MEEQEGRPVFLDATHLHPTGDPETPPDVAGSHAGTAAFDPAAPARAAFLARRFPTIDRAVRERGLDWAREPIPVTPAAHYLMGGVATDLVGRTTVPGLYAVGEVARTGVHGANRLASNSLLEGAVFGARAGDVIATDAASGVWPQPDAGHSTVHSSYMHTETPVSRTYTANEPGVGVPEFSRRALQELMWEHAGLVRDERGLGHAASVIAAWRAQERESRTERDLEDENLLLVAERLVAAARERRESVGAHYRSDAAPSGAENPLVAEAALAC